MPIPDYQTLMLPLLRVAADGEEHRVRDAIEQISDEFQLTEADRAEMLPSGRAFLFSNRIGWATFYLKQAGLIESRKRGVFRITPSGEALLLKPPAKIDNALLNQYEKFRAFRARGKEVDNEPQNSAAATAAQEQTPEEAMSAAHRTMRKNLEAELLDQVKAASPAFFERLVVDLLLAMGYGGSRQDAGRAIGKSGDGGIDGTINEDRLGLDVIYIQAKRWEGTVGRPEIQKFAGALQGQRASKGVFITTSNYSRDALEYVNQISTKIILIDGDRLASLMVDHNVAVAQVGMYEIKRVDTDYFEEV